MSDITRILNCIERGDVKTSEELLPAVYNELRRLATHKMASEPVGHTLQPTALEIASPAPDDQLLALNDALDRFAALEPQQAELVKLRYFVGLKIEEAADVLGISEATAKRWWTYARAWLFNEISPPQSEDR